jgi:hypothetical protein
MADGLAKPLAVLLSRSWPRVCAPGEEWVRAASGLHGPADLHRQMHARHDSFFYLLLLLG